MALIRIRNTSGAEGTWQGITLADEAHYDIPTAERPIWADDEDVYLDIANQNLTVNDGTSDYTSPMEGWKALEGVETLPKSDLDAYKLSVHTSYKPKSEKQNYAVWTGAGDDVTSSPHILGNGDILMWNMNPHEGSPGSPLPIQETSVELRFSPEHGKVWIHEGYLRHENGGCGDYMESWVMADPTPVQTLANKILVIEDNWIKYAVGSPNPATHGWGGNPILIPRSFSQDGDWDYDGETLTPNLNGTGGYKISDIERIVHHYFNKISCCGTSPYFSMTSDETTLLPEGYFIRTTAFNVSNTAWNSSIIVEIYRERTFTH